MRHVNYIKVCDYCSREFIAQKSSTRFCSRQCTPKAYKEKRRKTDILTIEKDTERQKKLLQKEEFKEVMCVFLAAKYLGISRSTLYRHLRSL